MKIFFFLHQLSQKAFCSYFRLGDLFCFLDVSFGNAWHSATKIFAGRVQPVCHMLCRSVLKVLENIYQSKEVTNNFKLKHGFLNAKLVCISIF